MVIVDNKMATDQGRSGNAGFTLIEILVALSLLAMMGGMTAVFLGQMRRVAEIQSTANMRQELDATTRYIERSLTGALALPLDLNPATSPSVFDGTPSRITFVDVSRLGTSPAALRRKSIGLKPGSPYHTLEMSVERRRPIRIGAEPLTVPLLENLVSLRFQFLGQSSGDTSHWQDHWNNRRMLPLAIRATITIEVNNRKLVSTAVARPVSARPSTH